MLFVDSICWLLAVGCWLLAVGCWLLAVGCWLLAVGCWLLAVGCWLLAVGCWHFLFLIELMSSNIYCLLEISLKEIEKASFRFSGIER